MNYEFIFYIITSILILSFIIYSSLDKLIIKVFYEKNLYRKNVDEYLKEVDSIVDLEFNFIVVLSHIGKEINMITDFKGLLTEIVNNVNSSLSPDYIREFELSTKLSKKYLNTYIIRRTELKLMEYMKEHQGIVKKEQESE